MDGVGTCSRLCWRHFAFLPQQQRGLFTVEALDRMLNNQGVGSRQLWGALSLELWFQTFIDDQY